ncbi:amidase [Lentzea sp. NPDC092896]|uniref:amidase n=1 Tax=Lentzea sp. NPDC092896 TaxID=3364127 RepID=UPI00382BF9D5
MLDPCEDSITGLRARYRSGEVSVHEVVARHLDRIEALDGTLNAVVTLNPHALSEAAALDASRSEVGPLHGIPVVVKDNIATAGIATAVGSVALCKHVPDTDATVVTVLRRSGAIILGKTAMPDFAVSWHGHSSRSGYTRNPYDVSRDPGGSSSGTAAAVAANLAAAGIGTDTGGSIRVPASFCGLVGIRPTVGAVSRHGIVSLVREQDTPGPLARSVADAAALLDVMTAWDPHDPSTAGPAHARRGSAAAALVPGALSSARIGVVRALCATGPADDPAVADVIEQALAAMRARGAELVDIDLPGLGALLRGTFHYPRQSRRDINRSLALAGTAIRDVADIVASGQFLPALALLPVIAAGPEDPSTDPGHGAAWELRTRLQHVVAAAFAEHRLSALAYPTVRIAAPRWANVDNGVFEDGALDTWTSDESTFPTNTLIAAQAAFPAITLPAGQTSGGLPVGLELLGLPHDDTRLIALAFDTERALPPRPIPGLVLSSINRETTS